MMRATRLDECGEPVAPPCNAVLTNGFVSAAISANVEDGEQYQQKLADGSYAINEQDYPTITNFGIALSFAQVDPDLFELLSGAETVDDYAGDTVGVRFDDEPRTQAFALEIWTNIPAQACSAGQREWAYWLMPFVVNGVIGDFTIENALASFSINAITKSNAGWGSGPYDVVPINVGNTAGPLLTPIGAHDILHGQRTSISPPTGTPCGCIDVTLPAESP